MVARMLAATLVVPKPTPRTCTRCPIEDDQVADGGRNRGARPLSALWKIVEFGGVVDEDTVAHGLVWRPIEHQIDQDRVVRLGFGISHARVGPVAAPD